MFSFWERTSFIPADLIVVGAGITGLSTAVSFKEKNPNRRVLVLEKDLIPTCASTRNAGFACFGSLTEIAYDKDTLGIEQTLQLVADRWKGLALLRNRLGDHHIDFHQNGGYDLLFEEQLPVLDRMEEINSLLKPIFKADVYHEDATLVQKFGFQGGVKTMIANRFEGQLDTGKMMHTLRVYAGKLGVEIFTGAEVLELQPDPNSVKLVLNHLQHSFTAPYVVLSNSCNIKDLATPLIDYPVEPARNQVLITQPLDHMPFEGSFHFDEGFYYFRNVGNRVLFGGGRNLDMETERTAEHGINTFITDQLATYLREVILPNQDFAIEAHWSGIMDMGPTKMPFLQPIADRILVAGRLGGMGVALGSLIGSRAADLVMERV